jgi:hypothetical protein
MQSSIDREVSIETLDYAQDQVSKAESSIYHRAMELVFLRIPSAIESTDYSWDTPSIMPCLAHNDHMVFRPHDRDDLLPALTRYSPRATCFRDACSSQRPMYIARGSAN